MSGSLHLTTVAAGATEHRPLIITLFGLFVVATLIITIWAGRQTKDAADFYAGGRQFTGFQNGLAISGDYMSAASFLGIAGAIALFGYDGFLYSIGFLVAWLVALLLVAEPLRNSGRYTMGDVLAYRMRQRPVRTAARHLHHRGLDLLPARPDGRSPACSSRCSWGSPATAARSPSSPWSAS